MSKTLFAKNSLYVINKGHIEPVLNFWAGKLWFKTVDTCWFDIWVKRVYKDAVKTFPNGLYGCQTAEEQHSLPPRLPGITNSFELKGGMPVHTRTKMKSSFEALTGEFA